MSAVFHVRVPVRADADVAAARVRTRQLAAREGSEALATALSERARRTAAAA
jgi:hypothetical protein